ncbi:Type 4 prepilin-like proteins leader peptide-processing enzyme [compost metagenome]
MTAFSTIEATFISAVVFIFGLMIGSFLNVVIYRLPADESIVWPGSHCPNCNRTLTAWENIPVLSWLALGAKCKGCKSPISWRYPAIELATGALFLFVYSVYGLSWQTAFLLILVSLCMVTFWIDIDHMVILDVITLPGVALGLLYSAVVTGQFWYSLAAVLYGVAVLLFINSVTMLFIQRDGIGGGDFTLVAMLGAWLGLQQTLLALGLAMFVGAAMGLVVLFGRWLKDRRWQPFALAFAVGAVAFVGFGSLLVVPGGPELSFPGALWGAHMTGPLRAAVAAFAALLGASAGWLYMRTAQDEGYLEMPFGPALVLGGLGSLFWGAPFLTWYAERMGAF